MSAPLRAVSDPESKSEIKRCFVSSNCHEYASTIVYDRYHMQAQFGKEVLGVVRLEEARKHKHISEEILA